MIIQRHKKNQQKTEQRVNQPPLDIQSSGALLNQISEAEDKYDNRLVFFSMELWKYCFTQHYPQFYLF